MFLAGQIWDEAYLIIFLIGLLLFCIPFLSFLWRLISDRRRR